MGLAVELDGVRKAFAARALDPEVVAVDGLSLAVTEGEAFGFLGRNGAGKTTSVKIMLGMIPRYEGSARLFGVDARCPRSRAGVGYLSETPAFPSHLRAREVLSLHGRLTGLRTAEARRRAGELLDALDLAAVADRTVRTFSKGMLQRLGIAVALVGTPRLVFLDEPTANLDPVGRRQVKDLLLGLRRQGTTVFLNSHILSEIEMTCTRVAIMSEGRLLREGTVDELTQVSHYVHIGVTPISDALLSALREHFPDARIVDQHIVAGIDSESEMDPIPRIVERHGAGLRYLAMESESLESVFLRTVGAAEEATDP